MQPKINNIVLVRFSLRIDALQRRVFFNERGREKWFAYRSQLFFQTLSASINAQSVKPIKVFLLMDTEDRALQERYLSSGDFIPIFTTKMESAARLATELNRCNLTENIAITRIDSDDIIEKRYFEKLNVELNRLLREENIPNLIVTCKGYRSNFSDIQPLYHDKAPFITLFRKKYVGEDVYGFSHSDLDKQSHIKNSTCEWMQVIHGTNVANGFRPANTDSLELYLSGDRGLAALSRRPLDDEWFKKWAGFPMPDPVLFQQAPVNTAWARIRKFWRGIRGKN